MRSQHLTPIVMAILATYGCAAGAQPPASEEPPPPLILIAQTDPAAPGAADPDPTHPGGAATGALDRAINLVLSLAPAVNTAKTELRTIEQGRDWNAQVTAGYAAQGTDASAEGLNAGVQVQIPLFDRTRELEAMRARAAVGTAEQQTLSAFLGAVRELTTLRGAMATTAEVYKLTRCRMIWHDQQRQIGLLGSAQMWPQAEAAVNAEHAAATAATSYQAQLETVSREYARGQWQTLRGLLGEYLTAQVPRIEQTDPCTVPAT